MRKLLPFLIMIIVSLFSSTESFCQIKDIKIKLGSEQDQRNFSNFSDFNRYFLNKEKDFLNKQPNRYYLYSVKSWEVNTVPKKPSYFRISDEFLFPQYTNTIGLAFNPLTNSKENFNVWIGGRVGVGVGDTKQDRIQNFIGGEVEFEYLFPKKNFSIFGGLGLARASIKDFNENITPKDSISLIEGAGLFDLFGGVRYYLQAPQANSKIGIHLKVGMNFWNGINREFTGGNAKFNSNDYYIGLGVGITSLKPLGRIGTPTFIAPETEVNYSPMLGSLSTKILQPVRLLDGFSAALTGSIGIGLVNSPVYEVNTHPGLKNAINKFGGVGVDLRFFDYDLNSYVNPYLSWSINFFKFNNISDTKYSDVIDPKYAHFITLGDKIRIAKSNWYINISASVAFWQQISSHQRDSLGLNMSFPSPIDLNFGIGYKFNSSREKRIKNFQARLKVYDAIDGKLFAGLKDDEKKEYSKLDSAQFKPADINEKTDSLFEERTYLKFKTNPGIDTLVVSKFPNLDLSDIKFFRISLASALKMDLFTPGLFKEIEQSSKSQDLLIAMFNKRTCDVSMLKGFDMFVHFNDLDKSRYFGYRYDNNRQLQPETRDLPGLLRDPEIGPVYYGKYSDYVKKMKWIDEDKFNVGITLTGTQYQDLVFHNMNYGSEKADNNKIAGPPVDPIPVDASNYRLAYAVFPRQALNKIKAACDNFGVSILFRKDLNGNRNNEDPLLGYFTKDGLIDPKDGAFFSNVVNGSEIYNPEKDPCNQIIELTNFALGSSDIRPEHRKQLKEAAEKAKMCNIAVFIGFTDSVEFNNKVVSMDNFIDDFSGLNLYNNNLDLQFKTIAKDWEMVKNTKMSKLQYDMICQKALAFRRIYSVIKTLKDDFGVDPKLIEVSPVGIWPNSKDRNNPKARRVEIRFTQS